jgi:hypothetical protein
VLTNGFLDFAELGFSRVNRFTRDILDFPQKVLSLLTRWSTSLSR